MTESSSRDAVDGAALAEQALDGDRRATARLLTLLEDGHPEGQAALATLFPHGGRAHIVGFTGSTGSGKSTLLNQVAKEFRRRGAELAVVAVDPTSPITGGALLGDRLRMRDLAGDPGIFIRSMASRGDPGGVARATRDVVTALDGLGFPLILVETVGAGQAQVEIARIAQTIVLVEAPGMGDDIQALKAGLMEIADIIVVNKADRPEAKQTLRALRRASLQGPSFEPHHARDGSGVRADAEPSPQAAEAPEAVPILETSALEGWGIEALVDAIVAHQAQVRTQETSAASDREEARRKADARAGVESWLQQHLYAWAMQRLEPSRFEAVVEAVARREQDPASAARELLEALIAELR